MQLNIYILSHPTLQILSKSIRSSKKQNELETYRYQYMGLLLIYEISRKWIKLQNIYIKKFTIIKELLIIDSKKKYYIFTSVSNNYNMLSNISMILPNAEIIDTEYNLDIFRKNFQKYTKKLDKMNTEILILDKILSNSYTLDIIKYLTNEEYIPVKNINIGCISCYNQFLNIVGNKYSELKIYTTQIIK